MAVRSFNGTSDQLVTSNGAATANPDAATLVVLQYRTSSATDDDIMAIMSSGSQGSEIVGMRQLANMQFYYQQGGNPAAVPITTQPTTNAWCLAAVTKTAGSQTPRGHWKNISSGAWTHTAGANTTGIIDSLAPANFMFGNFNGQFYVGQLAVAAYYDYALTDLQIESLLANLRTSDLFHVSSGGAAPRAAWEFNQASTGTAVTDVSGGGANQTSLSGTSVVTGNDPSGWTFDGKGTFGPSDLTGLQLWLRADVGTSTTVDGTAISQWNDGSGNARHATQATGTLQPLYKAAIQNGLPAVRFDATDDWLGGTGLPTTSTSSTIFAVTSVGSAGTTNQIFSGDPELFYLSGALGIYQGTTVAAPAETRPLSTAVYTARFLAGATSNLRRNGSVLVTGNAGTDAMTTAYRVGNHMSFARPLNGDMHEVVVYDRALTLAEVDQIESYLVRKWGLGRYRETILATPGLLGYWRLGESGGSIATTDTGAFTGTYTGGVTYSVAGLLANDTNTAVTLDGTSGYVNLGDPAGLQPASLSVEAWIATSSVASVINVVRKRTFGYELALYSGRPSFGVYDAGATLFQVGGTSNPTKSDGLRHHLVGTYDGATVRLYVDGAEVLPAVAYAGPVSYGTGGIAIGRAGDFSGSYFPGTIDEVAIYNVVLGATTVKDHYVAGVSWFGPTRYSALVQSTANLSSYWRLDERSGAFVDVVSALNLTANGVQTRGGAGLVPGSLGSSVLGGASGSASRTTATTSELAVGTAFSAEIWVRPDVAGTRMVFFHRGGTSSAVEQIFIGIEATNTWEYYIGQQGAGDVGLNLLGSVTAGTVYHVVMTWDGLTALLYVNGTNISGAGFTINNPNTSPTNTFTLGSRGGGSLWWNGAIDDAAFYTRALTATEVSNHYAVGTAGAPAFDAVGSPGAAAGAGSTWNHTCSGTNRYLVVQVGYAGGGPQAPSSVTYAGIPMQLLVRQSYSGPGGQPQSDMWGLASPPTGTNGVVVTWSPSAPAQSNNSISFTGVDPINPSDGRALGAGANSANPTCPAKTGTTTDLLVAFTAGNANATVAGGATSAWTDGGGECGEYQLCTGTAQTMSYTAALSSWAACVVTLQGIGGAAAPPLNKLRRWRN